LLKNKRLLDDELPKSDILDLPHFVGPPTQKEKYCWAADEEKIKGSRLKTEILSIFRKVER